MDWYYSNNGTQTGPITESELKAKVAAGLIQPSELAWCEGMTDWKPISTIPSLAAASVPASETGPDIGETTPDEAAPVTTTPPATAPASAASPAASSPYQTPGASVTTTADPTPGKDIPTYMWQSIAVTLLCCLPFGVVAIVYAAKVDGLKQAGDLAAARAASNSAKLWVNLSAGVTLLLILISVILNLVGVAVQPTAP